MGISHPPPYTIQDPNAPQCYDDLFPPKYATFCILQWQWHTLPHHPYLPPESMILDPPLLIPLA